MSALLEKMLKNERKLRRDHLVFAKSVAAHDTPFRDNEKGTFSYRLL
ncbi:MAG: hypothetical protein KDD59_00130 [Bdellovibrionales bacterium]|nr:hypothetical protein [Bdellovibrionales bacterium]